MPDERQVQAADITSAYQSAVAAAGRRDDGYRPFTDLRLLRLSMGRCWPQRPPSLCHALLSLLRWASRLRLVARLSSTDQLLVPALSYLPSVTALSADCYWPPSFARFAERKCARTGQYKFLATPRVTGYDGMYRGLSFDHGEVLLRECSTREEVGPRIVQLLQPTLMLFAAYQRSLSCEQQAVLARWAAGNLRPGDEQLRAVESTSAHEPHWYNIRPATHSPTGAMAAPGCNAR